MFSSNTATKSLARKIRGLTLVEALLFLGIAGVVIVGAVTIYNTAANNQRVNQVQTQIQGYVTGVKQLYANQTNYDGLDDALIIASGRAPSNAIDGEDLVSPWGTDVDVTTDTSDNDRFNIVYSAIPEDACINVISSGLINSGGVLEILVDGSNVDSDDNNEITPAEAVGSNGCSGAENEITFVAR